MRRVVSLLTDFGLIDSYVAEVKAAILFYCVDVEMVDISHMVESHNVCAAQIILQRSWHRFPCKTIHLAVIDPGVGSGRRALAIECNDHLFVGPDNGLFGFLAEQSSKIWQIELGGSVTSHTFHGRDIFAPFIGRLLLGAPIEELCSLVAEPIVIVTQPSVTLDGDRLLGEVVWVDHFGNLITNIDKTSHVKKVLVGHYILNHISSIYNQADKGGLLALWNSSGKLEIAITEGSAAEVLGLGVGTPVTIIVG